MGKRRLVFIASPYSGDVDANVGFALDVCYYAQFLGFAPFASHLLYPLFLDDDSPEERAAGMESGFAWGDQADEIWFCIEEGQHFRMSNGMTEELEYWQGKKQLRFLLFTKIAIEGDDYNYDVLELQSADELERLAIKWREKQH